MRKLLLIVSLVLCACLALPAYAAPCRDARGLNGVDEELDMAVSLFGGAALLRDVYSLAEGEEVPAAMAEGALLLGYGRQLLAGTDGDPDDGQETVSAAEAASLLPRLFAGAAVLPDAPTCPCIKREGENLVFDLSDVDVESAGGAHIFSAWQGGARVTVLADLYNAIAGFGEALELVPEEYITWIRTARFVLEKDVDAVLGYRLVSMEAYPDWLDGAVSEWELVLGEDYEVNMPTFFVLGSSEDGTDTYTVEGLDAQLTIQALPAAGENPLEAARAEYAAAHPEAAIAVEPELNHFTAETDGAFVLAVWPEGSDALRLITLTFPSERQYEFSFYGEIIRNSFYCDGMGLG